MKALIPAAGLGKRWAPWSRVIPKEMLPMGRLPAIHFILNEAVYAGIEEIGIVISKAKRVIFNYVEKVWQAQHRGVDIVWFYQSAPRGVTDALLCSKDWVGNDPVAVMYPDEIHPPEGGIIQLCKAYQEDPSSLIGLTDDDQERRQAIFKVENKSASKYRICNVCNELRGDGVKYGTGRYILGEGILYASIRAFFNRVKNAEEVDDDVIFRLVVEKGAAGIVLCEPILDIGTPKNWVNALITISENMPNMVRTHYYSEIKGKCFGR